MAADRVLDQNLERGRQRGRAVGAQLLDELIAGAAGVLALTFAVQVGAQVPPLLALRDLLADDRFPGLFARALRAADPDFRELFPRDATPVLREFVRAMTWAFETTEYALGARRWHATGETLTEDDMARLAEHDAIVTAIETGNAEAAGDALRAHISKAFVTRLKLDSGELDTLI